MRRNCLEDGGKGGMGFPGSGACVCQLMEVENSLSFRNKKPLCMGLSDW